MSIIDEIYEEISEFDRIFRMKSTVGRVGIEEYEELNILSIKFLAEFSKEIEKFDVIVISIGSAGNEEQKFHPFIKYKPEGRRALVLNIDSAFRREEVRVLRDDIASDGDRSYNIPIHLTKNHFSFYVGSERKEISFKDFYDNLNKIILKCNKPMVLSSFVGSASPFPDAKEISIKKPRNITFVIGWEEYDGESITLVPSDEFIQREDSESLMRSCFKNPGEDRDRCFAAVEALGCKAYKHIKDISLSDTNLGIALQSYIGAGSSAVVTASASNAVEAASTSPSKASAKDLSPNYLTLGLK